MGEVEVRGVLLWINDGDVKEQNLMGGKRIVKLVLEISYYGGMYL